MRLELLGCRVVYNRFLEEPGIPYVFECTADADIGGEADARRVAGESLSLLGSMLGLELGLGLPPYWEYIGRRFNLFSYPVIHGSTRVGQVRVVEAGGSLVNVTGAFTRLLRPLLGEDSRRALASGGLESGRNLGIVYLDEEPGEGGMPQGQKRVESFIVYAAEGVPDIDPSVWRLRVRGLVSRELELTLEDLLGGSGDMGTIDFHCVTGWSVTGRRWEGVLLEEIARKAGVRGEARWVMAVSVWGYSSIAPLDWAVKGGGMVAVKLDGRPLPRESGYPARLFLPTMYGWKSAKWLREIVFLDDYLDGYWEALSYHERGLVSRVERFKVRSPRIAEEARLPREARPLRPASW